MIGVAADPKKITDDHVLNIATAPSAKSKVWKQGTITWREFCDWAKKPADKKECGGYILGRLRNGRRTRDSVIDRCAVALDADWAKPHLPDLLETVHPWAALIYSTWRHTPADPRYRLIFPTDRRVEPDEYPILEKFLEHTLGPDQFDKGSAQPERFMYWPSTQDPVTYEFRPIDGDLLPVDKLLAEARSLGLDAEERSEAEPPGAATPASAEAVQKALNVLHKAEREVAAATGARNVTVFRHLPTLYKFVKQGCLDRSEVEDRLWEAAQEAGGDHPYTRDEFNASCASAWGRVEAELPKVGDPADDFTPWTNDGPEDLVVARLKDGAAFLLDLPDHIPAVWGRDNEVLWAEGEALTLAGPPGVGKTTLAGQVIGARLIGGSVLGYPVAQTRTRVLYLAMDRPRQIARALARNLADLGRDVLSSRLVVWEGPPLADVAAHPHTLLALANAAGADTVVVDSIKDAAVGLSNDEVGAGYNRARQMCIAAGVEVLELHHMVKKGNGGGPPTSLADMYGSTWIGAGSGSVILLNGNPGDPVVLMRHLKQPAEEVGPYQLVHDHVAGTTAIFHGTDVLALARTAGADGITARAVATAIEGTEKPTAAQVAKARRRLNGLVAKGLLTYREGQRGGSAGGTPAVWVVPDLPESDYESDYA